MIWVITACLTMMGICLLKVWCATLLPLQHNSNERATVVSAPWLQATVPKYKVAKDAPGRALLPSTHHLVTAQHTLTHHIPKLSVLQ